MTTYRDLALALAIGLLIGVERGWHLRHEPSGSRVAGVRTFVLLGITGGAAGLLATHGQSAIAAVIIAGVVAVLVAGYLRRTRDAGTPDATTAVAALLTLILGGLATGGFPVPAVASAAVATLVLSQRRAMHGWVKGLTATDIKAVARFAIIAGAIWPLLPDRNFGPYAAWNPRDLWLIVVVVTGLSFAGYAASRHWGATKGILATAAIGAAYSSTAVSAALAQRLRSGDAPPAILRSGIAIASAVMFGRVLVLAALLAPFALPRLAMIVGPPGLLAVALAAWSVRSASQPARAVANTAGNPFELLPAIGFALFVALLALVVRWAEARYGSTGIATLLTITGAMDVDAAVVTMGGLPPGTIDADTAGMILSLPILLNTLVKSVIVVATAGWRAGLPAAAPLLLCAAVMPLALLLTR